MPGAGCPILPRLCGRVGYRAKLDRTPVLNRVPTPGNLSFSAIAEGNLFLSRDHHSRKEWLLSLCSAFVFPSRRTIPRVPLSEDWGSKSRPHLPSPRKGTRSHVPRPHTPLNPSMTQGLVDHRYVEHGIQLNLPPLFRYPCQELAFVLWKFALPKVPRHERAIRKRLGAERPRCAASCLLPAQSNVDDRTCFASLRPTNHCSFSSKIANIKTGAVMGITNTYKTRKGSSRDSVFSDQQIHNVAKEDAASIAQWTLTIAKERGVRVRPRPNEQFIQSVSRLSDGVVDLDPVEQLLVELGRAGVISAFQRGLLQVRYLR